MIMMTAHINQTDGNEFFKKVSDRIEDYQKQGLEVEIQYQHNERQFSALILGRSNKHDKN